MFVTYSKNKLIVKWPNLSPKKKNEEESFIGSAPGFINIWKSFHLFKLLSLQSDKSLVMFQQITQYSCDYQNLAPEGCTQYYFGSTSNTVNSFNFYGGTHLADQNQNICVRWRTKKQPNTNILRDKKKCHVLFEWPPKY